MVDPSNIVGLCSGAASAVAAAFWFMSSKVQLPSAVGVSVGEISAVSPEFEEAMTAQSKANARGALAAAVAAVLQVVAALLSAAGL